MKGSYKRHVLKTISYRLMGTTITVTSAWLLGAPIGLASMMGVGELLVKPVFYFIHERIWFKYIKMKE